MSSRYWGLTMSAAGWVALSAINGLGATIQGVVKDTLTSVPVESVLVTIKGSATTTFTNAQGVFAVNTTTGIRDHQTSVPALTRRALRESEIKVYNVNGTYREVVKTDDLSGLPAGVYLISAGENGQVFTGKTVKMHGRQSPGEITKMHDSFQAGVLYAAIAKATAAVTLVYTHKYYYTKESAATEGDTSVTAKIKLLPPSLATTGPRITSLVNMTPLQALSAYGTTVTGKRITGDLQFFAPSWQYSGPDPRGRTFTFVDCEIQGEVGIYTGLNHSSGNGTLTPDDSMVTLNMSYCRASSGISSAAGYKGTIDHCSFHDKSRWAVNDTYNPSAAAPGHTFHVIRNCYFWAPYQTQPSHYEVMQNFTKVAGLTVINCTFEQQGGALANTGITGIINGAFAPDNLIDHCYFLWDGTAAAYYSVYAAGNGTFRNCFIEDGTACLYPGSQCTFTNCRSYTTGSLLILP